VTEGNQRVLIVEDDPELRALLVEFLRCDFATFVASSADEGVEVARTVKPNLILCDLNMPGKCGLHTIREVRSDPAIGMVPIILMSGQSQPPESVALNVRFLPKPFPLQGLLTAVETSLSR
jgi:DNA-binding response OmpR family regulator